MAKGPQSKKPEFWSKEWYVKMKEDGNTDMFIMEYLDITNTTLARWKKELKLPRFAYTFSNAKGGGN
jgi:hypothetical protein